MSERTLLSETFHITEPKKPVGLPIRIKCFFPNCKRQKFQFKKTIFFFRQKNKEGKSVVWIKLEKSHSTKKNSKNGPIGVSSTFASKNENFSKKILRCRKSQKRGPFRESRKIWGRSLTMPKKVKPNLLSCLVTTKALKYMVVKGVPLETPEIAC